jgi:hypothetical protein
MLPTGEGYRLQNIALHCMNECGVTLQRASMRWVQILLSYGECRDKGLHRF